MAVRLYNVTIEALTASEQRSILGDPTQAFLASLASLQGRPRFPTH